MTRIATPTKHAVTIDALVSTLAAGGRILRAGGLTPRQLRRVQFALQEIQAVHTEVVDEIIADSQPASTVVPFVRHPGPRATA